jgi:probable HAF family extracellular repeat protein
MRRVLMLMSVVFLGCLLGLAPVGLAQTAGGFTQIAPTGAHGTFANGINAGMGSGSTTCLAPGWTKSPGQHNGQTQGQHVGLCNNPNAIHTGGGQVGSQVIVGYYVDSIGMPTSYTLTGTSFNAVSVPGALATYNNGVNSSGQIVGYYVDSTGDHGFVFSGSTVSTLDVPGGIGRTVANGINDSGQVVGFFVDVKGAHGFLYSGGIFTPLDYTAPGTVVLETFATGINASGQIVGFYYDANFAIKAFQRSAAGVMSPLDIPGAVVVSAQGINTSGQVVGWYVDSNFKSHGFVSSGGTLTNVDVPSSLTTTVLTTAAYGIDDKGEVVGYYLVVDATGNLMQFGFHMP